MRITLVLAVMCLGLFSCEKEYTCQCTSKTTDSVRTFEFPVNVVKKDQAENACTRYMDNNNLNQQNTTDCKVK